MTSAIEPNFAMLFETSAFYLVHLAGGSIWVAIGHVSLEDPHENLNTRLLLRRATRLAAGPVATKLIIPNSEIHYTTCPASGGSDERKLAKIRVTISQRAKLPADALAIDWIAEGKVARVAVVHSDTLKEAEIFARQRGFNPVSFAAIPEAGQFGREANFGPAPTATPPGNVARVSDPGAIFDPSSKGIASYLKVCLLQYDRAASAKNSGQRRHGPGPRINQNELE